MTGIDGQTIRSIRRDVVADLFPNWDFLYHFCVTFTISLIDNNVLFFPSPL